MSAQARWAAYLAQIETRHAAAIAEAEAEGNQVIATIADGGDQGPLATVLAEARRRLGALESAVQDTWSDKVEAAFDAEGLEGEVQTRAQAEGIATRRRMSLAADELDARVLAHLARTWLARGQARARPTPCARCGVTLAVSTPYRHVEAVCACGNRQEVAPDELLQMGAAVGAHALAQEAALTPWRAMRAAEDWVRDERPPVALPTLRGLEQAQLAYWRAYIQVRAQLEPELGRDPAAFVRSRMEPWYQQLEFEEAWVAAGRPRAPI